MQKNVREIAVIMQDKEKEYKICEKLRRQPELRDLKILCREQLQSLGPSETFNKRLKRLQPLAGRGAFNRLTGFGTARSCKKYSVNRLRL